MVYEGILFIAVFRLGPSTLSVEHLATCLLSVSDIHSDPVYMMPLEFKNGIKSAVLAGRILFRLAILPFSNSAAIVRLIFLILPIVLIVVAVLSILIDY